MFYLFTFMSFDIRKVKKKIKKEDTLLLFIFVSNLFYWNILVKIVFYIEKI